MPGVINRTLVVILVFNEAENIVGVLDRLARDCPGMDVLVVNDGSWDNTEEILNDRGIFVATHIFNLGIGASFQTGCRFAQEHGYEQIVRMDGDGQHEVEFIYSILEPVKNGDADIVVGSRFIGNGGFRSSTMRRIGISVISNVLSLITRKRFTDPTSGFCAMNRKAFSFFAESCVEDYPEPEIFIHHGNFRINEVSISMSNRKKGVSSISPLKSIYYMYKVLLSLFLSIARKEK